MPPGEATSIGPGDTLRVPWLVSGTAQALVPGMTRTRWLADTVVAWTLPLRPPPPKRLRQAHWVAIDYAVTALLALGYAVLFKTLANLHGIPQWAGAGLVALLVLPAAVRRPWPRAVLALVTVAGTLPQP